MDIKRKTVDHKTEGLSASDYAALPPPYIWLIESLESDYEWTIAYSKRTEAQILNNVTWIDHFKVQSLSRWTPGEGHLLYDFGPSSVRRSCVVVRRIKS